VKRVAALVGAVGLGLIAAPPAGAVVADDAAPSLVVIETPGGEGVGFALGHPRRVVTSSEVVGDAGSVKLTRDDGSATSADVLAVDPERGLAILRANTAIPPLEETEIPARADDAVVAVAITLDEEVLEQRASLRGFAAARGWRIEIDDAGDYAGAPVLDDEGDVTAVVGAGAADGTGIPVGRIASLEEEARISSLFPDRSGFGRAPFVIALVGLALLLFALWLGARLLRPRMRQRFALTAATAAISSPAAADKEPLVFLKNSNNQR
jgi:hypothetical protein